MQSFRLIASAVAPRKSESRFHTYLFQQQFSSNIISSSKFLREIAKVFSFPTSHNPRVLPYPNLLICSKGKSRFHTSLHRRPGKIISFFFPGSNQLLGCPHPSPLPPRITPLLFGSLGFNPQVKPFPKLTSTDYSTKRMDRMTDVFSCRQF